MRRFHVRALESMVQAPDPLACLRALPAETHPILLLDQTGGRSLLAWNPDARREGRLTPQTQRAEPAARSGPQSRWPLAQTDPAQELEQAWTEECWSRAAELPELGPAWFGWFGASCAHAYEPFPWGLPDATQLPDWSFARYPRALVWEADRSLLLLSAEDSEEGNHAWREEVRTLLGRAAGAGATHPPIRVRLQPEQSQARYLEAVSQLRAWIGQGELFQANLSHALSAEGAASPRELFAALASAQPTAHAAYWEGKEGTALLSHSPERFLRVSGSLLETRPIKGTASRGANLLADDAASRTLESSTKERAELAMIVDMARNDLGRVALPGTVEVLSLGAVEAFPTLFHRTATVRAQWDPRVGFARLWAAVFPPASVTGAPKVRALQAMAELEGEERGVYCGALGWWRPGSEPAGEFSVLIRTAVAADNRLRMRVGAGIVWDSDPQREWEETLLKGRYWDTLR